MRKKLKTIFLYSAAVTMFSSSASFALTGNYTNFINAVRNNDYNSVKAHVNSSFVNAKDSSGRTALSYAVSNDNYAMATLLMNNGASPNVKNADGNPSYCDAKGSGNQALRNLFSQYDYTICETKILKPVLIATGIALAAGGVIAAASGGGGGGSGGGGNNKLVNEYGLVGKVSASELNRILASADYSNSFSGGGRSYSNYSHYNQIRLAYSLARGLTGQVNVNSKSNYPSLNAVDGKIKVAVLDSGVQSNNSELSNNIVTGLSNSNLAYLYCLENPSALKCTGSSYVKNDSNPTSNLVSDTTAWHGTAVASVIAGEFNGGGVTGIAPDADILPYRLTFDDGNFVSNYYIGEAFRSAADAGAVVINNSWGIPTKNQQGVESINASDMTSKDTLLALFRDRTHGSGYNNFFDQMLYAVTQKDTIFVWSTGNNGTSQPGITTSAPLLFDEFKNGNDYKNFIAVAAYDTANDRIADYSNRCGVAMNYCITAPGTGVVVSIYPNGDLDSTTYSVVNGTSFAAPMVSGAVAALKGAFPYMTGAEITKLIFVTARDLGDTGVDEVYGWGMLDLERASRPVGSELVPVDTRVDGRKYSADSSFLKLNSRIANNLKSKDLTYVFVDDFNRTFDAKLNDKIEVIKDRPKPIDVLNRFASGRIKPIQLNENKTLSLYSSSSVVGNASNVSNQFKVSYNTDNINNSNYGFSFYYGNNPYNAVMHNDAGFYNGYALATASNYNVMNPYFRNDSFENFGFNNKFFLNDKLSFGFGVLYQDYTLKTEKEKFEGIRTDDLGSSMSLISNLTFLPYKYMATTVELGFINEKNTLFASKTDGAFSLGSDNNTYIIGLQNDISLYDDKLSMFGKANFGYTRVGGTNNSLINNVSDLYTNSFAVGMNYNIINEPARKSSISFIVAQSVKINSGSMSLRLPASRDDEGNLFYSNHKIGLKDKGNVEYQLSYNHENVDNSEFNAGLIYSNYSDGYEDRNEGIFMLKYKKAF
ncbi:MAG: S8 family serine peptidase [Lactobacillaceae bacterium]|jgi:hypothetical protein|nr:S8 family serine peptidase [Lactobacillaceae bacterium]